MNDSGITNLVELRGALAAPPAFSHESRGESFYIFPLEVRRLSGAADTVNVVSRESLLQEAELCDGSCIRVSGELRSFNNKSGDGAKLVISVFARELALDCGADVNTVELQGALCKAPNLRTTPMGREICDLMLAVGRRYSRSDYLPCICWGLSARRAATWEVGDRLHIKGRIQSRKYIKLLEGEALEKVAYEVSAIDIERLED